MRHQPPAAGVGGGSAACTSQPAPEAPRPRLVGLHGPPAGPNLQRFQKSQEIRIQIPIHPFGLGLLPGILADRDFLEHFLLDPLGKENNPLLMTRGAEIPSFTRTIVSSR